MTFTYTLPEDIALIRLELGDTTENAGVRPEKKNFSDEELQIFLDREGEVMRAVAAACEALARMWSTAATSISVGPRSKSYGEVSQRWATQAKQMREQYGGGAGKAFSVDLARQDGYSANADGSGSEFADE